MARGWESKSVESQIESAHAERGDSAKRVLTVEMAAAIRKKESLLLARNHLLQQIQASQNPRHRTMLEGALAGLDQQIAAVNTSEPSANSD
jgi:hypothetical protein